MGSKHRIGVYCIKNKTNQLIYIGKSNNIVKRFKDHRAALKSGEHHCKSMQIDYNSGHEFEYDVLFEVLNACYDTLVLDNILSGVEMWYSLQLCTSLVGYNLYTGASQNIEKARKRAIDPETANNLLCTTKEKTLTKEEKYAVNLIAHVLDTINWNADYLYYFLKQNARKDKNIS